MRIFLLSTAAFRWPVLAASGIAIFSVFSEFERAIIQSASRPGWLGRKLRAPRAESRSAVPALRRQLRIRSARHMALAGPVCAIWLRSFVLGGRLCVVSCVAATETP